MTRVDPEDYEWPCERRVAHGPHGECPGVKAHPNTQIGSGDLPRKKLSGVAQVMSDPDLSPVAEVMSAPDPQWDEQGKQHQRQDG